MARTAALLNNGVIEIDNSAVERALRAIAIGRRSYLIGTAKLNGIAPEVWLPRVTTQIADHPVKRVNELLPWNFPQQTSLLEKYFASQRGDVITD